MDRNVDRIRTVRVRAPPGERSGFVLPIILLYIMVLAALGGTALLLSGVERQVTSGDLEWLRRRMAEDREVAGDGNGPPPHGVPLEGGFLLHRPVSGGPATATLSWLLDGSAVASGSAARVEAGAPVVGGTITRGGWECGPVSADPFQLRPLAAGRAPDPPLPDPPALGPLGIGDLTSRASGFLLPGDSLGSGAPGVWVASAGSVLSGGEGAGLLLVEGDLVLSGTTRFDGLALIQGNLFLSGSAHLRGSALVGGGIYLEGGGVLELCPRRVEVGLDLPSLRDAFPLGPAGTLGRF